MKKITLILVSLFAIFTLVACGSNNENNGESNENLDANTDSNENNKDSLLAKLQEEGKVVVGFANEKPYAYQEDGELKGAAVDIARAVFKELGIDEVEGQLADFKQLISGLNAGKFSVVTAGMAITPDRCENAAFGEPEMMYGEGLIVQKGNPLDLHSYKDIADNPDATISIMSGATEHEFVKSEGVDPDQIQSAPDIPATFSAVQSGRADATTGTAMSLKEALESLGSDDLELVLDFEQPDIEGMPSYGAAAFNLENEELREAYNEVLIQLKEDGKIAELIEPHGFSGELNTVPLDITTDRICSGELY